MYTNTVKYLLFLLVLVQQFKVAHAQSNEAKAKAYYFTAQEQYEAQSYIKALDFLEKSEDAGGSSNAYIEALRAECYAKKQQWFKAKKALDKCYTMNPSNQTLKRVSPLILEIDHELDKEKEKNRQKLVADKKAEEERLIKLQNIEQERLRLQRENQRIAKLDKRNKPLYDPLILEGDRLYAIQDYAAAKAKYVAALAIEYSQNNAAILGKSKCEAKIQAQIKQKATLTTFRQKEREAAALYKQGKLGDAVKKYTYAVNLNVPEREKTQARARIKSINSEKYRLTNNYATRIRRYNKTYYRLKKWGSTLNTVGGVASGTGGGLLLVGLLIEDNSMIDWGGVTLGAGAFFLGLNYLVLQIEATRVSRKSREYKRRLNYISLRMDHIPRWVDDSKSVNMIPSIQFNSSLNNRTNDKIPVNF